MESSTRLKVSLNTNADLVVVSGNSTTYGNGTIIELHKVIRKLREKVFSHGIAGIWVDGEEIRRYVWGLKEDS